MRHFESPLEFAAFLLEAEISVHEALEHGLDKVLERIEKTAHSEFGHYQPAVGPFPAWAELADSTKDQRVAAGYTENDPLLASGALDASLEKERHGLEGGVGTPDPKMAYLEFGTSKMPPRPVLGPAAFRNKDHIRKLIGASVVSGLIGGDLVHQALGYDFKTGD